MQLIPVIDLLEGQVVRAVRGDRATYRPVRSALCEGANPVTVAGTLARHCASDLVYLADLDALQGAAPQVAVLTQLLAALPHLHWWLDAGFNDGPDAARLLATLGADVADRVTPVFGSESLRDAAALQALCADGADGADGSVGRQRSILSLDRRDGRPLDRAGCWSTPSAWPERVVVMTLERVGAGSGPDLATLATVQALAPQARLIGAGGVRHVADLRAAEAAGAHAWLVASALHDGAIPAASPRAVVDCPR
jgi:phosphoribosylformimino-5-aminoimidazole carboxamide ribotide isomerase